MFYILDCVEQIEFAVNLLVARVTDGKPNVNLFQVIFSGKEVCHVELHLIPVGLIVSC